MMPASDTFRMRLFYILMATGLAAALLMSLCVIVFDISTSRGVLIRDLRQIVSLASDVAGSDMKHGEWRRFVDLTNIFPQIKGLNAVCVYNADYSLVREWQSQAHASYCPPIVRELGINEHLTFLNIAEPVRSGDAYLGMVYAQATLLSYDVLLARSSRVLLCSLLVAFITCALAAYFGARHINRLMDAVRQQIECLKGDATECLLPPVHATRETIKLFDEIRSLRIHLLTALVPRDKVVHMLHWHENLFFHLFLLIRHRIPPDSTLLPLLSDCELLLRFNTEGPMPDEEVADVTRLVDEGMRGARMLNPPGSQVHFVVSFKSPEAKQWKIRASYLRTLIRHLLLIALARTRSGLICLRLEIIRHPDSAMRGILVWRLEDSGPAIQPGVLQSLLAPMPYKTISVTDASWLLAVQLARRLGGTMQAENLRGGILLSGEIPLGDAENMQDGNTPVTYAEGAVQENPRLVLMVGEASPEMQRLCVLLEQADFRVIKTEDYIQALELAPAMPFSAIILNEFLDNSDSNTVLRRVLALMENHLMPAIPVWMVAACELALQHKAWSEAGAREILFAPIASEKILSLCARLVPFNPLFWSDCDSNLLQEYSNAIETRLPEMRSHIAAQILQVQHDISNPSVKHYEPKILHNAHTVKSAALALGYMRLAALMANLEYMLAAKQSAGTAKNIALIADCLKKITLK